ncbi:MAG: hypothetical protein QNJ55_14930 [Xenococcus sp. MO_188.B8]|nr:hypothetical protein [Xenococcus sp. MO_188.B8]
MSKPKNIEEQLAEIDNLIAAYKIKSRILEVEILKLELKREKMKDKIIYQQLKEKQLKPN